MTTNTADEACKAIYGKVQRRYLDLIPDHAKLGFQILYGPPHQKPPVLFIGYQPGGGSTDYEIERAKGSQENWPDVCEYATATWRLAKWLQSMFGVDLLNQCVGLNAIFYRAPNLETYRNTIRRDQRKTIQEFCMPLANEIISMCQPKCIVAIGFETLSLFGESVPDLQNEKGRVLTRAGNIIGQEAIGTLHLSGAHISTADRARIRDRILRSVSARP
jgi:hypothetical protein